MNTLSLVIMYEMRECVVAVEEGHKREALREMKKAMRKHLLSTNGRVDRVLFGRVSIFFGGDKSFGDEIEWGWGSTDCSVEERSPSMGLGKECLRSNTASHSLE